uniref:Uncharacterized protein n=1 Tax=Rhabditophanes sp. KR3021 TaxID=114890 RepID=A0AC35TN35_9BILA
MENSPNNSLISESSSPISERVESHAILMKGDIAKHTQGRYEEFQDITQIFEKLIDDFIGFAEIKITSKVRPFVEIPITELMAYIGKLQNTCVLMYCPRTNKYRTLDKKWILSKMYIYLRSHTSADLKKVQDKEKNMKPLADFNN